LTFRFLRGLLDEFHRGFRVGGTIRCHFGDSSKRHIFQPCRYLVDGLPCPTASPNRRSP